MNSAIQLSELTSRDKLSRLVTDFRNEVTDGNMNPLQAAAILKALEDFTKQLRADILIRDCVKQELDRYPEKVVHFNGITFTKKTVGTKYDYSGCNDEVLVDLRYKADIANNAVKSREDFLKAIPAGGIDSFNPETGETFKLYPPVKISEDGYAVSLSERPVNTIQQQRNERFADLYCDAMGNCFTDAGPGL